MTMTKTKRRARRAIGPRLRKLLHVVFALFALLGVNSLYLGLITFLEWYRSETVQNYFYQVQFLVHIVLGLLLVLPVVIFGALHLFNTYDRPNRRAVRVGYALFTTALVLIVTGFLLLRLEVFEVRDPRVRGVAYWAHVIAPFVVVWLFILHRLSGPRLKWRLGLTWGGVAGGGAVLMALFHSQDPKRWNVAGPESAEEYFFPSLSRTVSGDFIPADVLQNDRYCMECHADAHERWAHSAHRFASFNNPAYRFSVRETREVAMARDGDVRAARFCAGCHDPVPFFSGAFDDPDFDDVNHPTSQAGITCTACHAITHVNSPRGNADYTIEAPSHYPFAFSETPLLKWINRQLVKAKPAFHKKTFLKPLHTSAEFCGACHKVHLPVELNDYKWLRGQNHYDSYHLSGVSGHGAQSFYYPPQAIDNCSDCHMELMASSDFGAAVRDDSDELKIHDHLFPSANTAIPDLLDMPEWVVQAHRDFNEGVMRVDIFGVREGGTIEGELTAPIGPEVPALVPGERVLFETVIRTVKMGHLFTQGTADSNQIWMDIIVRSGERVLGRSGGTDEAGRVDPWSHFVNSYVLDRNGNRIDRRNAQDIFVPLYNHQIPPGAADVVHYVLDLPDDLTEPVTVEVSLKYRKFDTLYLEMFQPEFRPERWEGRTFEKNELPILILASDRVTFPLGAATQEAEVEDFPEWQRWNDYGIGLLRKAGMSGPAGELKQAEEAFEHVAVLGRADGPLNLARVYLREGRLGEAVEALGRAASHDPPAPAWTVGWLSGLVNQQNGFLEEAIESFQGVLALDSEETRRRGFDFSQDYRVWNELGVSLFERAKQERGEARRPTRLAYLERARDCFEETLALEPENLSAHYNLGLLLPELGDEEGARLHQGLHRPYKPDDNARDSAVAMARRRDPAANHASEAVVLYDLARPEAFGLPSAPERDGGHNSVDDEKGQ